MSCWWIALFALPFVNGWLGKLKITGISWGGRYSEHPGLWWTRSETVYVRKIGEKP